MRLRKDHREEENGGGETEKGGRERGNKEGENGGRGGERLRNGEGVGDKKGENGGGRERLRKG